MIRQLAPLPTPYRIDEVTTLTLARFPAAQGVNEVDVAGSPNAAVYFADVNAPTPQALTAWRADVAAHVPSSAPTERELAETIRARAVAALAANAAFIAAAKPGTAAGQASAAYDAAVRNAKAVNGMIRLLLDLTTTVADT